MDFDPLFLSRVQFAFTVAFHIIFPSFTIGLAAWLTTLEILSLRTGRQCYRRLFDFWVRIFTVSFSIGVVSGIVMAFQMGMNWSVLADKGGPIQGPLLGYEAFTAFMLEASFLGIMLFGRSKVSASFYAFACAMVALGTSFSMFWIMVSNTWMQHPVGFAELDGQFVPVDWSAIVFNQVFAIRVTHMMLSAYLTTAFCVAAVAAAYLLRNVHKSDAILMIKMSLGLAAVLIPLQLFVGHLNGDYVHEYQPAKFAAIEARWEPEQPASEVLFAIPDPAGERNLFALSIPRLGSFIASGTWDSHEMGLSDFPPEDRPPVEIPFYFFRIMVAMGMLMWLISWGGVFLLWRERLQKTRWFLWATVASFPTGFIAVISGWMVAEVGRQPWVIYGVLRTADAHTPSLSGMDVLLSLLAYIIAYSIIFTTGIKYMWRLVIVGPIDHDDNRDVVSYSTRRPTNIEPTE
jgi:cytochrome d ubiquinol oxidase subunit I